MRRTTVGQFVQTQTSGQRLDELQRLEDFAFLEHSTWEEGTREAAGVWLQGRAHPPV